MMPKNEHTYLIGKWEQYKFHLYIPEVRNNNNKPYLYIYYPIEDAETQKERIRIYKGLNRHASVSELKKAGKAIATELISKLKSGWNPVLNSDKEKLLNPSSKIPECLDHWIAYREEVCRYGGMKQKALASSRYLRAYLTEWLLEKKWLLRPVASVNKYDVELFLRTYAIKRKWGKSSYNTYRCLLGTFFNYLVGLQVLQTNPVKFTKVLNLKHDRSRFKIYEEAELKQVAEALSNDPAFADLHIAAKLVFLYNIRPSEILRLQVSDIDLQQWTLTLAASKTKNQNEAVFALNEELCLFLQQRTTGFDNDWYVFDGRNRVSAYPAFDGYLEQRWRTFRKKHGLAAHLRFYALKHSSNYYDLKDGASLEKIRNRNRHSNLQVTTMYIIERLFKEVIESSGNCRFSNEVFCEPEMLKSR